ncbi:hypothetical protein QC756_13235 [Sinorhizobium meliloti]|uniref:hypothetical protein n=1 Tax=Rhizobium meliloti TaxID=382 RepID=UPI00244DF40E|nr:hypothetical protein [Sinorhizobium meliloti]WGI73328.1 hypothetical protein QC756_13235 [Sinorhizobium meliloti]
MTEDDTTRLRRVLRKLSESSNANGKIQKSLPVVAGRKESVARTIALAKAVDPRRKRLWKVGHNEEPVRGSGSDAEQD